MKKGIISTIIILIFAGVVFYFGFVSYKVPNQKVGVLVSKTSGVYKKLISNDKFLWKWECLIPKNTELYTFSKGSYVSNQTYKGALPSAEIYSSLVQGNPDFTFNFDFDIKLSITDEMLLSLVEKGEALGQSELNQFLEEKASMISRVLSQYIIDISENNVITYFDTKKMIDDLQLQSKFSEVVIEDIVIKKASVPDYALYKIAKNSYQKFQDLIDLKLKETAEKKAEQILDDDRAIKKLAQIGELLQKYPELNALLSSASSAADILKTLNEFN